MERPHLKSKSRRNPRQLKSSATPIRPFKNPYQSLKRRLKPINRPRKLNHRQTKITPFQTPTNPTISPQTMEKLHLRDKKRCNSR